MEMKTLSMLSISTSWWLLTIHMRGWWSFAVSWGPDEGVEWEVVGRQINPPTLSTHDNTTENYLDQNRNESAATGATAPAMSIARNVSGLQATFGLPPNNPTVIGVKRPSETSIAYPTWNKNPIPN